MIPSFEGEVLCSYRTVKVTMVKETCSNYQRPTAIRCGSDVADLCRAIIAEDPREHFLALYLDVRHKLLAAHTVAIGYANGCPVHPREIFLPAVALGAVAVIVAHNHPSGDPEPSVEDKAITERLEQAGELLGIPCLDHIVLGDDAFYSFTEGRHHLYEGGIVDSSKFLEKV